MYYEINVARKAWIPRKGWEGNYLHFFATSDRSLTTENEAIDALNIFNQKFPESEGYLVTVTLKMLSGRDVTKHLKAVGLRK